MCGDACINETSSGRGRVDHPTNPAPEEVVEAEADVDGCVCCAAERGGGGSAGVDDGGSGCEGIGPSSGSCCNGASGGAEVSAGSQTPP